MNPPKYQNKYRIPSARLQTWDYGSNAAYFITICTAHRECFFGTIEQGIMQLSDVGTVAEKYWFEMPEHFPFIKPAAFVVMPNHVHGIIIIDKTDSINDVSGDAMNRISTGDAINERKGGFAGDKNPMLNENLSRVVRWYKGRVSFRSKTINPRFSWQSRFHDHIIRDDESFYKISRYIEQNPQLWKDDTFYLKD